VAQGTLADEQAAVKTAGQFFQALTEMNYKQAGLICGGELETYARHEFGSFKITKIISVGPALAQTDLVPRGFRVPCKLEIDHEGHKYVAQPDAYVRPGDDESHPDRWNIAGGVNLGEDAGDCGMVVNQQH